MTLLTMRQSGTGSPSVSAAKRTQGEINAAQKQEQNQRNSYCSCGAFCGSWWPLEKIEWRGPRTVRVGHRQRQDLGQDDAKAEHVSGLLETRARLGGLTSIN